MTFGFLLASRKPPSIWKPLKSKRTTNTRRESRVKGEEDDCEKPESVVGSGELVREEADDELGEDSNCVFSSMASESSDSSSKVE